MRRSFVTEEARRAYLGWVHTELRHGPDKLTPKRLSHVPRLLWEIESGIRTGEIVVRPDGERLATIRAIKTGEMPYDEAMSLSRSLLDRVQALDTSHLPEPPVAAVEALLHDCRRQDGGPV